MVYLRFARAWVRRTLLAAGAALAAVVIARAGDDASAGDARAAKAAPYPLSTCPVSGKKLGSMGAPAVLVHDGTEIRFCCKGCIEPFKSDPKIYLEKVALEIAKDQERVYPLETCVVSGRKLAAMGRPVDHVKGNRLFRLCCRGCVATLMKDPEKYALRLEEAVIAAQKATYPLTECVVSGQKLGSMGDPVDLVVGGRLVRLCCEGCLSKVRENPAAAIDRLRADAGTASTGAKEPLSS